MFVGQFAIFLILLPTFRGVCLSSSNNITLEQTVLKMQPSRNEHDLIRKLMSALFQENRYDKTIRPVKNIRKSVDVWLRLNLRKISEVIFLGADMCSSQLPYLTTIQNTPSQYMTIQLWALQAWKDENLAWDPAGYGGIDHFVVSENAIWTPDINLENNLRPNYLLNERRTGITAKILHPEELQEWQRSSPSNVTPRIDQRENGAMMFFSYPATYKFMCHMNVAMFPFDTQTCSMVFGSWNYFDDQLKFWPFNYDGSWDVDLEGFTNNSQWTVVSFKMEPVLIRSDVPGRFHANVRATIVLKRQAITYMVTLICPTLLTTFSSLVGFFMPTSSEGQRREKMTLGINSLLTMSILLMGVSDQVPCTSTSVPLIGIFYVGIIVISAISTLCTTFVINFQRNWLNFNLTIFGTKLSLASSTPSCSPTTTEHEKTHFKTHMVNLYHLADRLGIKRPDKVGLDIYNELLSVSKDLQCKVQPPAASETINQSLGDTSTNSSYIQRLVATDIPDQEIIYRQRRCKSDGKPHQRTSGHFDRFLSEFSRRLNDVCRNLAAGQRRHKLAMEWDWLADVLDRLFLIFWLSVFGIFVLVLIIIAFYT